MSGCEKRKKKQKIEEFNRSQVGALEKFISRKANESSQNENENDQPRNVGNEDSVNEEHNQRTNENNSENLNENNQDNDFVEECEVGPLNIYDPGNWDKVNQNVRDFIIRKRSNKNK